MDSPQVQRDEPDEPGSLPVPLADEDLPAWWGPILDSSARRREQLGGAELDLDALADVMGSDPDVLREFASTHTPVRRYLVAEPLSVTVWAAVYVAIDMVTKCLMVLKVSRRVVEIEGMLIAAHDHPNVVKALDVFVHEGYPTTVLEWCRHGTLRTLALAGVAHWREILARAIDAGRGLAHLHAWGLVHGDVKPSNILITHGTGKIADLGLAGPERLHGVTCGTPSFAPPEREHGVFVFAGDVYSFALTIEQSLHGHEGVPPSIGRVLEGALAADYQRRPTLARLLADLQRELDDERVQPEIERRLAARDLEHRREFERHRKRSWLQTAVVLAVVLVTGGTMAIAAQCRPITNIELAEQAAERGDGDAAVQNLELAMRQAKLDADDEALREVAGAAETLGHDFIEAGDRLAAHDSWFVARECFSMLGDEEGEARMISLVTESARPAR